ncbi:Lon protease C-terminal proteolytic domain-containing protein [Limtongia smithiae]|uniref:Lon protease C-terminal proteolytic domain-containing protein n=1 Tax=Limtongia smithiae TaxID=1125753 RepID=UPI0034CD6FFA
MIRSFSRASALIRTRSLARLTYTSRVPGLVSRTGYLQSYVRRDFSQSVARYSQKSSDDDNDDAATGVKKSSKEATEETESTTDGGKSSETASEAVDESVEAAAEEGAAASEESGVKERKSTTRKRSRRVSSEESGEAKDENAESMKDPAKENKSRDDSKLTAPSSQTPTIIGLKKFVPDMSASAPNQMSKGASGVPEEIPELMALPIVSRPLFPGFYKAVVLHDERHIEAVRELVRRGQPYVGVFLQKDPNPKTEAIMASDEIYHNGVLAQITSVFPQNETKDPNQKEGLTIVLYPHRRIEIERVDVAMDDITPIGPSTETPSSEVTSFDVVSSDTGAPVTASASPMAFLRNKVTMVNVINRPDNPVDKNEPTVRAVVTEIVSLLKEISSMNPLFRDQITAFTLSLSSGNVFDEPVRLSDFAAAVSAGELTELQDLIDTRDIAERLQKGLVLLKKELMNAKLQSKINKDVESKIQKRQREYYLMEQMRGIRRELGMESDAKEKLTEKFRERAAALTMPPAATRVFEEELNKLTSLDASSSEFNVTRNYLDWITQLPWGLKSPENYSIKHAVEVLDEDHYGLKDVKDRILEFVAVGKLCGSFDGKILCLVGPPGVGKTSIGKSIARALNRRFERFSVGGLSDVAEIKGHRRTYVGALPGRVIQSLKKCQTENPLILIDEIDKIGRGHQGDPSSALLELLDPEQNNAFLDHYMDIPVDLSKVLFVCTANMIDTIPGPLLDRMEVIEVSGYIAEEKKAIALKYLAPQAKDKAGLKNVDVEITPDAIDSLIKSYCRESGVRNLKQQIEKLYRKSALNIVKDLKDDPEASEEVILTETGQEKAGQETAAESAEKAPSPLIRTLEVPGSVHVEINPANLKDYLGPPIYITDKLYDEEPPVGVVTGLAWTQNGGTPMYVESVLEAPLQSSGSPSFKQTGKMGEVMKESTIIAYTFAKMFVASHFPENRFFDHARIHLHCPEGATPKDGPSAGVTISTSLLSLALNQPIDPLFAMTGEITVTGRVLRIGGLREKTVAAKRTGAKTVFFPLANLPDWEVLPENIREGLEGVPCNYYDDVFKHCFKNISREAGSSVWLDVLNDKSEKTAGENKPLGDLFPPLSSTVNTEIRA